VELHCPSSFQRGGMGDGGGGGDDEDEDVDVKMMEAFIE
jgi:hypothetical protein